MSKRRWDWPVIRSQYVEGRATDPDGDPWERSWPTLEELATLHGVSYTSTKEHSAAEKWVELREQFQADIERRRREALAAEHAKTVTGIDRRALAAADAGLALVNQRMGLLVRGEIDRGQHAGAGVEYRELAGLGLAARRWVQVKDAVMGNATLDDLTDDERDARVAEKVLAGKLAARRAELGEDDDLDD